MRMKIKSIVLMALAASMACVACDKEGTGTGQSGAPKSVNIKLANVVTKTRSAGGSQIAPGSPVTLSSYQIFFSDGTTLYTAKDANNQSDADQYIDSNDLQEGVLPTTGNYHFLPAAVNKVIVIGNHTELNVTTEAELNIALAIADEQDADNLTLYATSALTPASPEHEDGNPLYTAELELAPRIARLFVKSFTCTFDTPSYTEVKIEKMAMNNYYKANTLASQETSDLENTVLNNSTVWDWFSSLTPGFHNDDLSITLTSAAPSATTDLYYHFFPGSAEPQLVVRAQGDDTPLFLATARFKNASGEPVVWKAGTIYEMDFAFKVTDFDQPDKCVDITVTPVKWVVETITPEF